MFIGLSFFALKSKYMKKITTLLATIALTLALSGTANAAGYGYGCQPIYGGGQTCLTQGNVLVNKTVQNPSTGAFVENLSVNDPRYAPSGTITFQISVTNTGQSVLSKITVTDTLPLYVSFVSGPGTFDNGTKKVTFQLMNLAPNETRVFTLQGQVSGTNGLPSNQTVTCDVNQVEATSDNGQASKANSQFCIEKGQSMTKGGLPIFPVPQKQFTTPATGPEMLPMIGIFASALTGFALRRKSK